jgi:hypothetical protein
MHAGRPAEEGIRRCGRIVFGICLFQLMNTREQSGTAHVSGRNAEDWMGLQRLGFRMD